MTGEATGHASGAAFRTATLPEVAQMLDWAQAEGWNPGLSDAAAFHATDPHGFFLALVGEDPVACISVVNHAADFAFLGLYICRPEHRGRGIGLGLWTHALAHAGTRTVGLDGVPAQQANYARSGFVATGRTLRFGGLLTGPAPALPRAAAPDMAGIARLDRAANGIDRPAFLRTWTDNTPDRVTIVLRDGTDVAGFATGRRCAEGCKVGPIVAATAKDALALARAAAAALDETRVFLDLPGDNTALGGLLHAQGFAETFATARMYRGPAPHPGPGLQAIATMELG